MIQHVVISGFRQSPQRPNGALELWRKLRPFADARTSIDLRTWDSDWADVAALMHLIASIDRDAPEPEIYVYAYSWGAGWGFTKLASELAKHGRAIHHAVLADPVYRSPWLPTWLPANPLSLTRFPTIAVPHNVRRVSWTYQRQNRPWGHEPIAENRYLTRIDDGRLMELDHVEMDNAPAWHAMCLDVANASHARATAA